MFFDFECVPPYSLVVFASISELVNVGDLSRVQRGYSFGDCASNFVIVKVVESSLTVFPSVSQFSISELFASSVANQSVPFQ